MFPTVRCTPGYIITSSRVRIGRLRLESKYRAIQYYYEHKSWSIRWMRRKLGITRATYYKWLHRDIPAKVDRANRGHAFFKIVMPSSAAVLIFLPLQKYSVQGDANTGIKG